MSYIDETIVAVWEKAKNVDDNDLTILRKDECEAWIQRTMYGDRSSQYGREIDHILTKGHNEISNLLPLHWRNSIGKSDVRLICLVTSRGVDNKETS